MVGEASDGQQGIDLYHQLTPDVALLDLRMPRMSGFEVLQHIRKDFPSARCIVLSDYRGSADISRAVRGGAMGYLTKDAGGAEIRHALKQVLDNHAVIDPAVQHHVVDAIATRSAAPAGRGRDTPTTRGRALSRR